jgi:hypothetical protein
MLHPVEKWGRNAGQGTHNTLSTAAHTQTLSALFCSRVGQCRAVLAHVCNRVLKLYDSINDSVYVPCLQIRLAQFDSGSRLQCNARTPPEYVHFFSFAHFAHSQHTFDAVKHLRHALQKTCFLLNRVCS